MLELGTSGTVGGEGGNVLVYPATSSMIPPPASSASHFAARSCLFRFCPDAAGELQGAIISHRLIECGKIRGFALVVARRWRVDRFHHRQAAPPAGLERLHRLTSDRDGSQGAISSSSANCGGKDASASRRICA
jgi:hypothetical protein